MIPVGIPLPPAVGKVRLAALVAPEDVVEKLPSVTLRDAHREVLPPWQKTVNLLLDLAERSGVEPRVFGSLLWQRLTGLPYLSASSDLDLLWPATDAQAAAHLAERLAAIERDNPVRFDGEFLLPEGGGVHWREWMDAPCEVLVKTMTEVQLCAAANLFPAVATNP